MSFGAAQAMVDIGFADDDDIAVFEKPPLGDAGQGRRYAIALVGPPKDFLLSKYPIKFNHNGERERLIPGAVLNRFQRALWPV